MTASILNNLYQLINTALTNDSNSDRRLVHGRGRLHAGLEQVTVDLIEKQLVVSLFKPEQESDLEQIRQGLAHQFELEWKTAFPLKAVLLQFRYPGAPKMECLAGSANERPVFVENGLKYQLTLGRNQNSGLFFDMKAGRQWVRKQAQNKRVLNLFSYTCGFSVAAIEGGAEQVVNVDMAKAALATGRDNHRLNQHPLEKVRYFAHDIFKSWGKIKKSGPYELVIIDPPSFQKGSFALTKDYQKILRRLSELTSENALVLACVNSPSISSDFLVEGMAEHAPQFRYVERIANPPEFADADDEASLKTLVFERVEAE